MRASRIFLLARTIRWATVGGAVRKARAISSVVRPQTSRSVIATCASGERAGWQHVKINRSRSSSTLSSSHCSASLVLDSSCLASSVSDASNRARRRMPSMALKRPVETSLARGLAGTPSRDHCSTATVKASCMASSAASKSPSRRIKVADRKSTRLNSSHSQISYAVFCLKKKIMIEWYNFVKHVHGHQKILSNTDYFFREFQSLTSNALKRFDFVRCSQIANLYSTTPSVV